MSYYGVQTYAVKNIIILYRFDCLRLAKKYVCECGCIFKVLEFCDFFFISLFRGRAAGRYRTPFNLNGSNFFFRDKCHRTNVYNILVY